MSEHEMEDEAEDGRLEPLRWSWWDLGGLVLFTAGSVLDQVDNGLRMIAGRMGAHASWERDRKDLAEHEYEQEVARADMAGTLEGIVFFEEGEPQP